MKKVARTRIDTVAVTQLVAVPTAEENSLVVSIGFHDMQSNQTIADGRFSGIWSEDTYRALRRLYDCVETDVVNHVSPDGASLEEDDGTGTGGGLFPPDR